MYVSPDAGPHVGVREDVPLRHAPQVVHHPVPHPGRHVQQVALGLAIAITMSITYIISMTIVISVSLLL